jgi:hypothetical protein
MDPPFGRWKELYEETCSIIRQGAGLTQEFIERLVDFDAEENFKQLLMFNVFSFYLFLNKKMN